MKLFKFVLLIVGIGLIAIALYNAFVPQEVLDVGPIEVNAKEGLSNQTLIMLALGVVALLGGVFLKNNK